jgi:hypothetical protein
MQAALGVQNRQGSRLYYKTKNDKAMIFLIVGIVLALVNWIACLFCWLTACFLASNQTSTEVDFNDGQQQVVVSEVSTVFGGVKSSRTIPYQQLNTVALQQAGSGMVVVLTLLDGTTVAVSGTEPQLNAEARSNMINQSLSSIKQSPMPMQQVAPQQQQAPPMQQAPMEQQQQYYPPQQQQAPQDPQYNPNAQAPQYYQA